MTATIPHTAMVLAAGLGKRMRPITDAIPKPLIRIAGTTLLDRGLDALERAGVERAVVNIHHLGKMVVDHLSGRTRPAIIISDESDRLLDSAGGIVKALPLIGADPFFVLNADTFWIEGGRPNLGALAARWDGGQMDMLLLLADIAETTGHTGGTDFLLTPDGRLKRSNGAPEGIIYAGAAIIHPRIFEGTKAEPHSLNRYFDSTIAQGRLHGHKMSGHWITVGTPAAIADAELAIARYNTG